MTDYMLFIERGKDVVVHEDKQPLLYDHKERPLVRAVGFRSSKNEE